MESKFRDEDICFIESLEVKEGVNCEVYSFKNDDTKDLGIVKVASGAKTPLQLVLSGDKTIEIFKEGKGTLTITNQDGAETHYNFPDEKTDIDVKVGEKMQWHALEDLVFCEICYPPYKDGRFQNLTD